MITGLQDVYLNVADLERAVAFYEGVLGITVVDRNPHFTALDLGGVRFGLHPTHGKPVAAVPSDAHGPHGGGTLTLRTDDIDADRGKLEAAGAKILGSSDNPWGRIVVFADPDGNVLKLMQV